MDVCCAVHTAHGTWTLHWLKHATARWTTASSHNCIVLHVCRTRLQRIILHDNVEKITNNLCYNSHLRCPFEFKHVCNRKWSSEMFDADSSFDETLKLNSLCSLLKALVYCMLSLAAQILTNKSAIGAKLRFFHHSLSLSGSLSYFLPFFLSFSFSLPNSISFPFLHWCTCPLYTQTNVRANVIVFKLWIHYKRLISILNIVGINNVTFKRNVICVYVWV